MKTARHTSFFLFLFFIGLFTHQNAMALMATPMAFDLSPAPGEEITNTIQVFHTGKRPISLSLSIKDYYYDQDGKKQESDPEILPEGLGQFITVSPMIIDLMPGETKPVTFTVKLPPDVPGAHWATIYITQTSKPKPKKLAKGQSSLEIFSFFRVAVRIIQFDPSIKEKAGHISDMSVEFNTKNARHTVYMTFENDTINTMLCNGHVQILNENGEMVAKLPLYKRGAFMAYPYRSRVIRTVMKDKLTPGTYIALAMIDFGAEELVAGELEFEVK